MTASDQRCDLEWEHDRILIACHVRLSLQIWSCLDWHSLSRSDTPIGMSSMSFSSLVSLVIEFHLPSTNVLMSGQQPTRDASLALVISR